MSATHKPRPDPVVCLFLAWLVPGAGHLLLGRPGRHRALQRFLDHVRARERVWIARRIDIARHWRAVQPFDAATAFVWE